MYFFFIGLLFVAFEVTCHGAPERLIPVPQLPVGVSEEEKHVEKRALCTDDQKDKSSGCGQWAGKGYCDESSIYKQFMRDNCYASCGFCELPTVPPTPVQVCTDDQLDQSSGCRKWAGKGYCDESSPYKQFMRDTCSASCGFCKPAPTPVPKVDEDDCLQAHNEKRALHQNTPDLVWDANLAQQAKDWADTLAYWRNLTHAGVTGQGENLYWGTGRSAKTCREAVQSWYNEEPLYSYDNPPQTTQEFYAGGYGHFTQVVWKGTTSVGAGLKKIVNSDGVTETYVVARYSPQGNMLKQFGNNVEQKKP